LTSLLVLGALLGLLSGCSTSPERSEGHVARGAGQGTPDLIPKAEPRSRYGNAATYVVRGRRYYTKDDSKGYVERGLASWYGPGFHGRRTSSGERYDMHAMTAAHKTLPLPTYAKVTNLENGQSAVVRINDRGPFHGPRVIDLSRAAAAKLGVLAKGTAEVEVQALDPASPESVGRNPFLLAANKPQPQPLRDAPGGSELSVRRPEVPVAPARSERGPVVADAARSEGEARLAQAQAKQAQELVVAQRSTPEAKVKPAARRPEPAPVKGGVEVQVAAASKPVAGRAGAGEAQPAHDSTLADAGTKADRPARDMYLQVGAFGDRSNAEHLRKRLSKELARLQVQVRSIGGTSSQLYKVQVGPIASRAKASDVSQQLAALGVTQSHMVVD
jgi:rare lipoprotein A